MAKKAEKPAIDNAKYCSTGETKVVFGVTLHRIKAKVAIGLIAAGTLGGWIEKEENLDVYGNAWVSGDARVYGDAWVSGNARVSGNAWVYGNARVSGDARVYGDAWVSGNAQYITISPVGSENGCLTAFVQKDGSILLNRGCFSGSIDAFLTAVERRHGDSDHGKIYRLAVEMIKLRLDTNVPAEMPEAAE